VYRRARLHERFGGNRFAGIVPSKLEPVVLLFHTKEPGQQFYRDGFDDDGIYWYSGEAATGDMSWKAANRAVRDHATNGKELYLFERVQRKNGLWQLSGLMQCIIHRWERRPDKIGKERNAIIFGLLPLESAVGNDAPSSVAGKNVTDLRTEATRGPSGKVSIQTRIQNVYRRSEAVRLYALARSGGVCEACRYPAPFLSATGAPFLEVHHIDRLADRGPDRIDRVAAICPNCHRRCHYGEDAKEYNALLCKNIAQLEHHISEEGMLNQEEKDS
jgi:5-methylcytosine-specific restriction protein A